MTEKEMIQELENARRFSERNKVTVVAMGNGSDIEWFNQEEVIGNQTAKDYFESKGYWTVSIFVDGYRVEHKRAVKPPYKINLKEYIK